MARMTRCDRCKKDISGKPKAMKLDKSYDLCDKCFGECKGWIKAGARANFSLASGFKKTFGGLGSQ